MWGVWVSVSVRVGLSVYYFLFLQFLSVPLPVCTSTSCFTSPAALHLSGDRDAAVHRPSHARLSTGGLLDPQENGCDAEGPGEQDGGHGVHHSGGQEQIPEEGIPSHQIPRQPIPRVSH